MMLMVLPSKESMISDETIASGIEMAIINVARQLPRNTRIIAAVRPAAIKPSRTHTLHRGFDEHRLVGDRFDIKRTRHLCTDVRQHLLDLGDHVERRDVAALFDFEQGPPAVRHGARYWSAAHTRRARLATS